MYEEAERDRKEQHWKKCLVKILSTYHNGWIFAHCNVIEEGYHLAQTLEEVNLVLVMDE